MTRNKNAEPASSAKVRRVALEEQIAIDVERAIQAEGVTGQDVADHLGIHRPHLYRYVGSAPEKRLHAAWLFLLPRAVMLRVFSQHLAPMGLFIADIPSASTNDDDLAGVVELQRSTSQVVTEMLSAVADGHVTAQEGGDMLPAIDAAIAALLTARRLAESAVKERVVGIRRGPRAVK